MLSVSSLPGRTRRHFSQTSPLAPEPFSASLSVVVGAVRLLLLLRTFI
jgi:hypothetical protein